MSHLNGIISDDEMDGESDPHHPSPIRVESKKNTILQSHGRRPWCVRDSCLPAIRLLRFIGILCYSLGIVIIGMERMDCHFLMRLLLGLLVSVQVVTGWKWSCERLLNMGFFGIGGSASGKVCLL